MDDFLKLLKQSELIPAHRLAKELDAFRASVDETDGAEAAQFAMHLINEELLTPWQNAQLFAGKHKGFFLGNYKILEPLEGTGGNYLAEHTKMRRQAVIKILPQLQDAVAREKFLADAEPMFALDHPNIVQTYKVDQEGDVYFLAIQYVEGWSLAQLVDDHGPLDEERAADYVRQAAEGLAHAHEHGLIHRRLDPSHLLVDEEGTLKLLGFDEAMLNSNVGELPETTLDYSAPELMLADRNQIDARSDIYSLGRVLFNLLVGDPWGPKARAEMASMEKPEILSNVLDDRPELTPALADVTSRMIEPRREDRFQSMGEVAEVLAELIEDGLSTDLPAESYESNFEDHTGVPLTSAKKAQPIWLVSGLVIAALLLVGVGGWLAYGALFPVNEDTNVADKRKTNKRFKPFPDWNAKIKANKSKSAAPKPADNKLLDTSADLLQLFEESGSLVFRLNQNSKNGSVKRYRRDAYTGSFCAIVTGKEVSVDNWRGLRVKIRQRPAPGEFRYLRFAWKKQGGREIQVKLLANGSWEHRYVAGTAFQPVNKKVIRVDDKLPMDWVLVTRDLFADFGEITLQGIAFAPGDGEFALFDRILLARSQEDFDRRDVFFGDMDAVLVVNCGKRAKENVRENEGYAFELVQGDRRNTWPKTCPLNHCWYHDNKIVFNIRVPKQQTGTLRLTFVAGSHPDRKQKYAVEGKHTGMLSAFAAGRNVDVPISAADSADGRVHVEITPTSRHLAVISRLQFIPNQLPIGNEKTKPTPPPTSKIKPGRNDKIAYGKSGEGALFMDLFLPRATEPRPAIVMINGGWGGNNRKQVMAYAKHLSEKGYVTASINYRGATEAPFPAALEDCRQAVRWLRENADSYGIDAERIGVFGVSIGGCFAALLGLSEADDATRVQFVITIGGVFDLSREIENAGAKLRRLLRVNQEQNPRLYKRASPITHVKKGDFPPFLLLHVRSDPEFRWQQSMLMNAKLKSVGIPVEYHLFTDSKLTKSIINEPPHRSEAYRLIEAFLAKYVDDRDAAR